MILMLASDCSREFEEDAMRTKPVTARLLMVATGVLALSAQAHAINRYTSMSCAEVSSTISREGAAIMRYTSPRTGNLLYDRYVANRSFCDDGQTTRRVSIPTAGQQSCLVNRCEQIELPDFR